MDGPDDWKARRDQIIGLGNQSVRKSYYPELRSKLAELERFKTLLDYADDLFLVADAATGELIEANASATRRLALDRSVPGRSTLWGLFDDPTRGRLQEYAATARDAEVGPVVITTELQTSSGLVPVELRVQSVRLHGAAYLILVVRDVTDRYRAERALRESEERFRAVYEGVNDALFVHDPASGAILDLNRRACELYGYSREEVRQLTVGQLSEGLPPYTHADAMGWIRAAAAGEPQNFEWRARRKDGSLLWVDVNMSTANMGGLDRVLVAVRDVTTRKAVEEALRASEERLSRAQRIAHVSSWELDRDGVRLIWSAESAAVFERMGAPLPRTLAEYLELVHPEDRPALEATHDDCARTGRPGEVVFRLRLADGRIRHLAERVERVADTGAGEARLLGTAQDVTERRRTEDELRQSQKLEAVGMLAGGIAHDFNNLLTGIVGGVELSLVDRDEGARAKLLSQVLDAAHSAAKLVQQLLAFSRKQVISQETVVLNAVVSDLQGMLQRLIGEHVVLAVALDAGRSSIRADVTQLQQVLINLAVNARDAMPTGGRLLIATTNERAPNGAATEAPSAGYVCLTVCDTGRGISPAVRAHMFEPFFTTKGVGRGTGLGLATAYGIVRQHGGTIEVDSEPERGASFHVFFPLVEDDTPRREPRPPRPSAARGQETILLVEDEELVRAVASSILEGQGYRVVSCASGEEALRRAEQYEGDIHLLFTDIVMPGISGRQLAQRLLGLRPGLRVLLSSGYSEAPDDEGDESVRFELIEKPYGVESLIHTVRRLLDGP